MLDGILGRKSFKNKCKSALNRTQTRLAAIQRKRNAMQRFLKEDIADLLKNNLDRNAYGRAEGLLFELNLSSCYDYVDECCNWLSEHLKELHEKKECPDDCRVAVSSLVYAAARFADLPELRDLRIQFNEKYGDSLVTYVSKEFVEKLKSKTPSMEMKLQLIEDVAHQFSIRWNPATLKHELQTLAASVDTKNRGVSDGHNPVRSMSVKLQEKGNKEDYKVKQNKEEHITDTTHMKVRHTNSCPVVRENTEEHTNRNRVTSRVVLAPYKVPEELGKLRTVSEDDEELGSTPKVRPKPKSVRTKFLNISLSNANVSFDEREIDTRETVSAKAPTARSLSFNIPEDDEGDESENDVCTYFGKISPKLLSPSTAKSVQSPSLQLDQGENNNGKLGSDLLPLPPGRRRYFSDSQPNSPSRDQEDNVNSTLYNEPPLSPRISRFVPPELATPKSKRHSRSNSQSDQDSFAPRMPDFDELSEKIGALKQIKG